MFFFYGHRFGISFLFSFVVLFSSSAPLRTSDFLYRLFGFMSTFTLIVLTGHIISICKSCIPNVIIWHLDNTVF